MTATSSILLISLLIFASVAMLVLAAGQILTRREQIRQRYSAAAAGAPSSPSRFDDRRGLIRLDPGRIGLGPAAFRRLRLNLMRAGFFHPDGPVLFTLGRFAILLGLPVMGSLLLVVLAPGWGALERLISLLVLVFVAYLGPAAYLSRRARAHREIYETTFPDLLDMLVVCINAGLSLEAALDRVAQELGATSAALRTNLDIMAAEMRAGRSTGEALRDCAERLDLREARSFAALLQQTIELGTDVAGALTTFSDEMRDKRMSRAEARAAALPPKLTIPLGLCVFPVVLIVVLTPAVLRVLRVTSP